jgi:short-subunit dehydrogenase
MGELLRRNEGVRANPRRRLASRVEATGIDVLSVEAGPVHTGFEARAGLNYGSATTAQAVAEAAVAALGKRASVIPGVRARFLVTSLAILPRRLRARFLADVIDRMRTAASSAARHADSPV